MTGGKQSETVLVAAPRRAWREVLDLIENRIAMMITIDREEELTLQALKRARESIVSACGRFC
jgi:hypothetical protein